mmetsp:Transcript_107138/g.190357  ORF Transcript_107138/g.190357 Transcript_107138/m.190357 type:complete len:83 (-) Transcript_107138:332-580(-)
MLSPPDRDIITEKERVLDPGFSSHLMAEFGRFTCLKDSRSCNSHADQRKMEMVAFVGKLISEAGPHSVFDAMIIVVRFFALD